MCGAVYGTVYGAKLADRHSEDQTAPYVLRSRTIRPPGNVHESEAKHGLQPVHPTASVLSLKFREPTPVRRPTGRGIVPCPGPTVLGRTGGELDG